MHNRQYYRSSKQTSSRSEPCNVLGHRVSLLRWLRIEGRIMLVFKQSTVVKSRNMAMTYPWRYFLNNHTKEVFIDFNCSMYVQGKFAFVFTNQILWYKITCQPATTYHDIGQNSCLQKWEKYASNHDGIHKKNLIFVKLPIRMAQLKIFW
jgi:hypothetical protein